MEPNGHCFDKQENKKPRPLKGMEQPAGESAQPEVNAVSLVL